MDTKTRLSVTKAAWLRSAMRELTILAIDASFFGDQFI